MKYIPNSIFLYNFWPLFGKYWALSQPQPVERWFSSIQELKVGLHKHRHNRTVKRPKVSNRTMSVANWHRQDGRLREISLARVVCHGVQVVSLVLGQESQLSYDYHAPYLH